eukprot:5825468-Prymnesium_polylepis.1
MIGENGGDGADGGRGAAGSCGGGAEGNAQQSSPGYPTPALKQLCWQVQRSSQFPSGQLS